MLVVPTLRKLGQEDQTAVPDQITIVGSIHSEFRASLGYRMGPCFLNVFVY